MRINTNLIAMNTFNQYTKNNNTISKSVEKLSSGYAINSAADNAAGLAISEKMRSQIRGLDQASTNSQDAISLVQTAEGSLSESTEILQRMRELSVQSSNDTNQNEVDREALQDEFSQLQNELDDISSNTAFNKKNLLDGSLSATTAKTSSLDLKNSGMSVELGNVAAGSYDFKVATKLESAAVSASSADTFNTVNNSASFNTVSATPGTNITQSSLLNGNYKMSGSYDSVTGSMTITATGDNNQTFHATISKTDLATECAAGTINVTFGTNDDAFHMSFALKSTTLDTTSKSAMDNLAADFSNVTLSVSGGVDKKDAEYGVYANLTGADSVKLTSGMDSVTFSNGVKVNFDKLSSADVSTNVGYYSYAVTPATVDIKADLTGSTKANLGGLTITTADPTDNKASLTGFTFESVTKPASDYVVTVKDSAGNSYTATLDNTNAEVHTLNFTSGTSDTTFSMTLDLDGTVSGPASTVGSTSVASVASTGHYNYETVFGSADSTFNVNTTKNAGLTFQVGANSGDELAINIDKMDATYLGVASLDISTQDGASAAIKTVDKALNTVSSQRAYLGAIENRLDHKIANLNTSSENLTSAESEIRDVDMASEMTKFTNANILSQAATAMLAQANSLPQNVLSLLK